MPSPKRFWACTILALLAITSVTARAAQPAYDAIYVFGDSYCDVGNIYLITGGAEPLSPPYYMGRFSNGPIWVEHVASAMGLQMLPELEGGTDYAFGGAWATEPQVTAAGTIPDVPEQVALYLSQHGGKADPNALYVLEGGGNDIIGNLAVSGASANELGFKIALTISESELALRRAGARNFLIPDLFNVGLLPAAQANPSFADAASVATDKYLDELLAVEGLLEGIRIKRLNVFNLYQAIQTDATHFGFTNVTTPCLNSTTETICSDPDHTLFWDTYHPTEFGHAFFAVTVVAALSQ
ncbi:MAG: SGNH/GDSL hydrolase family protein [Terracidiphilus sp.]|jgi:outer membrane lipase/esterase